VRRRAILVLLLASSSLPACAASASNEIRCAEGDAGLLAAQAVPSATMIPCITAFPVGWTYGGFLARTGLVRFWMDSDRAGIHAIQVELTEACDTTGAVEVEGQGPPGVRRLELPISLEPRLSGSTFYTFAGGCVTLDYDFAGGAPPTLLLEANQAIDLFPRKEIVSLLEEQLGLHLCGAEAAPCVGDGAS
jgi:hypothetical protein